MPETTWEGWIRPKQLNLGSRQAIFSCDDGGYDRQLLIEENSDKLAAFVGSVDTDVFEPVSLAVDTWQHVVVTYLPTDVYIYLNGKKYVLGETPGITGTTRKFTIGANPGAGSEVIEGDIAYVAVYNRVLSDAEVMERCEVLKSRFDGATCDND